MEPTAQEIMQKFAEQEGWNEKTMLELCWQFMDFHHGPLEVQDFCEGHIANMQD